MNGFLRACALALVVPAAASGFTLQILHASDFEAGIPALEDAPRFSAVARGLKAAYPTSTVVLASGDNYVPGPFMNAAADPAAPYGGVKGRGDVAMLNAIGVQAAAFGNHEFDGGTALVASLLRPDAGADYAGTAFPYLSANLDFAPDGNLAGRVAADGQPADSIAGRIARSCTIEVGGQTLGIVGATTPELATLSNPGGVVTSTNVAAAVQAAVDALEQAGVDKIVLLAHLQQVKNEIELAGRLRGVDVVIAGGSHAVTAKATDRLRDGDVRYGDYAAACTGLDGRPVYVVNVGANYRYVGRLVVEFDGEGTIASVSPLSGAYATDDRGVADAGGMEPDPAVEAVVETLGGIIDAKDGNLFGRTDVYLNGRRESVRREQTNLGDLTAEANLYRGQQADSAVSISLKNAGGIRDSIGAAVSVGGTVEWGPPPANPRAGKEEGEISQLDMENALRFNNALSIVTVTAAQLRDALEWGVSGSGLPGQFPQTAGMAFAFDPARAPMAYQYDSSNVPTNVLFAGERLRTLVARDSAGRRDLVVEGGRLVGDSNRTFRLATLSFLANGGDQYYPLTLGTNRVDLADDGAEKHFWTDGGEQRALAEYLLALGEWSRPDGPAETDENIQRLDARRDGVMLPAAQWAVAGGGGALRLGFETLPGKIYAVAEAAAATGSWSRTGAMVGGDGYPKTVDLTPGGPRRFYRIELEGPAGR